MINCINILNTPYQPRVVYDSIGHRTQQFFWDANGNMVQKYDCKNNALRFHQWDDVNRLRLVLGPTQGGFYGYDANGDRVYKLTGECSVGNYRWSHVTYNFSITDAVLYPNPYMTITSKNYTKHYYAGSERIATVIGGGGLDSVIHSIDTISFQEKDNYQRKFDLFYSHEDPFRYHHAIGDIVPVENIAGQQLNELQYQCHPLGLSWIYMSSPGNIFRPSITSNAHYNGIERDIYFYHGDHLGSASWITDSSSVPIQYIHYAPYGELLANQAPYSYDERFKFTGKERDSETGYDFFGARYYWSDYAHFITPDPLLDNDPGISSYAYCRWNPMMFIDPDGKEKIGFFRNDQRAEKDFVKSFSDDGRLHVFMHANENGVQAVMNEKTINIPATQTGVEDFFAILANSSTLWNSYLKGENTEPLQVVLHGCKTEAMAKIMSEQYPDVYFTGTTEENYSQGAIELGPYSTYKIKITWPFEKTFDTGIKKSDGQWNTYKEGKLVRIDKNPSATPIKFKE